MSIAALYRRWKEKQECEQLKEGPPLPPWHRFRRYRYLAPIQTHAVCRKCHAPCCRLTFVYTAITLAEAPRLRDPRPWQLNIHYPRVAVWRQPVTEMNHQPRYRRVANIRLHAGGPAYERVEAYLAKKPDGSCVHFRRDGVCSIYAQRPHACKVWFCGRGTENDVAWQRLCEEERAVPR